MKRTFLPEVQALRAVAVLLVVVYHFSPGLLPGGYIGVDVFFVISGFLISGHMLREVDRTGRLSLAGFWSARARRILPAALVTILATLVGAFLLLSYADWDRVAQQSLASIFYVQNWVLAAESVDYLAADNVPTPVQHFWSLAVEEQFYLLWPFVVVLAALLSRRVRALAGRRHLVVLALFALVTVVSFVYSVVRVSSGDDAAYFVTTTRLWELGAGGILAVVLRYTDRFALARSALCLAGLAAIGYGALTLDPASHDFPGLNALFPVLGAMAVIAAGRTRGIGSLTPVVDLPPVRWFGDTSYSLYLWHFPVITFFTGTTLRDPGPLETLVLFGVAVALAAASYYGIEQPVRRNRGLRRRHGRTLALAGAAMLVTAVATQPLTAAAAHERDQAAAAEQRLREEGVEGAAAMTPAADRYFAPDAKGIVLPNPADARKDAPPHGCLSAADATTTRSCEMGDTSSDRVVALVGDSHANVMTTVMDELGRQHGWKVVSYAHISCPFSFEMRESEQRKRTRCQEANHRTVDELVATKPEAVVTVNYNSGDFVDSDTGHEPGAQGYAEVFAELNDAGIPVVAFRGNPVPDPDVLVPTCVAARTTKPSDCDLERKDALRPDPVVEAVEMADDATLVDLSDRYCGTDTCPAVIGNALVYRDSTHLSDTFVRTLTPYVAEQIPPFLVSG